MYAFFDYFHYYLSYIITVSAVHHPTKLQYPHLELIFGYFAPALLEVSFGIHQGQTIEKNVQKITFTLVP